MGLAEFAAGWALGAKTGERGFEEVVETAKNVVHSQELNDLLGALRNHVGYSLKELGGLVAGGDAEPTGNDLLDIVRSLIQRREGAPADGPPTLQVVRDALKERRPSA